MKIILDTNPIYKDFDLSQPQLQTIERYLSRFTDELYIPEVVIEEMIRHYQKEYSRAVSSHKDIQRITEIIGEEIESLPASDDAIERYRKCIQDRLDNMGAKVLPIPDADVKGLLQRDLAERKPFDSSGKGFRDALIWGSILVEISNHQEKIVLITSDQAFTSVDEEGMKILSRDLADDLKSLGISEGRVEVLDNLRLFNEKYVAPSLAKVYRKGDEIEGSFIESLNPADMLSRYQPYILRKVDDELLKVFLISRGSLGEVKFLRWLENAEILEAYDLNDETIQAIIRTNMLIDAVVYTDQSGFSAIFDLGKNRDIIAFPIETRWNAVNNEYEIKVRTRLIADIAIIWDMKFNVAKGVDLIHAALNEQGLATEDLSDVFKVDSA